MNFGYKFGSIAKTPLEQFKIHGTGLRKYAHDVYIKVKKLTYKRSVKGSIIKIISDEKERTKYFTLEEFIQLKIEDFERTRVMYAEDGYTFGYDLVRGDTNTQLCLKKAFNDITYLIEIDRGVLIKFLQQYRLNDALLLELIL